jgi:hypothetical protein
MAIRKIAEMEQYILQGIIYYFYKFFHERRDLKGTLVPFIRTMIRKRRLVSRSQLRVPGCTRAQPRHRYSGFRVAGATA